MVVFLWAYLAIGLVVGCVATYVNAAFFGTGHSELSEPSHIRWLWIAVVAARTSGAGPEALEIL